MSLHVRLGQFDTDGETLDDEDDARELERDQVGVAPRQRVDEIGGMRSKDDAADGCHRSFSDVQLFLDEEGHQHEDAGEASKDDVDQMGLGDGKMFPSHDCCWGSK